jgi:pimeloyl-ACP methyl ester carboxylesterase
MVTGNATDAWRLGERQGTSVGEVAYEVFGEGPPVVLVHGTPTRSYLWRNIVPALAEHRSVYVYDLLGYGESEKGEGQDVSIAAQARLLKELVEAWGLEEPAIAGHDIGGGIVLRAQLLEGVRFSRIAILDAVVLGPRLSAPRSSTWHVREHAEAYEAMPNHLFGAFFSAYLGRLTVTLGGTRSRPTSRRGGERRVGGPSSGRPSRLRSGTQERSSPGSRLWRSPFLWCGARRMGGSTPR